MEKRDRKGEESIYNKWGIDDLKLALEAAKDGVGVNEAAMIYKISKITLKRYRDIDTFIAKHLRCKLVIQQTFLLFIGLIYI